jgi:CPA2 family monovalent cation:H+ antiporter-2
MSESTLIRDLAVILVVSGAVTALFHRLRQPVVLGYLLAGVIIGPHTPPVAFIHDRHSIETLGELGVIFLLFSLGLAFSLRRLRRVGTAALVAALLEIPVMIWLGYVTGRLFGWGTTDSLFLGAVLSISSTTIIAKALGEMGLLRSGFARIIVGILIVEDLAAILILVLLSGFAAAGTVQPADLLLALGRVTVFVTCVVVTGLLTLPRLLQYLAAFEVREVLTVCVLGICIGVAALAGALGFSVALGAFLAGAVMAESRPVHVIEERVQSIRDMFSAVFFVAVGLAIDPAVLLTDWLLVLAVSLVTVAGKVVSCGFGTLVAGYPVKVATRVGMGLAQIGEFSFIIANLGLASGVMSPKLYPIAVGVSAVTTLLTPYLLRASDPLGAALERRAPRVVRSYLEVYQDRRRRRAGGTVPLVPPEARPLAVRGALYAILLAATVLAAGAAAERLRRQGPRSLVLPDDVQVALWVTWGIVSLPLFAGLARTGSELSAMVAEAMARPDGRTLVRDALRLAFAVVGVAFFLALGAPVLPRGLALGVTLAVIGGAAVVLWRTVGQVRDHAERTLRAVLAPEPDESPAAAPAREEIVRLAARKYPFQMTIEEVVLPLTSTAANRSLEELEIRARTGATVAEIVRDTESLVNPSPSTVLEPGDVLLVMGSREQVARAIRHLENLARRPGGGEDGR